MYNRRVKLRCLDQQVWEATLYVDGDRLGTALSWYNTGWPSYWPKSPALVIHALLEGERHKYLGRVRTVDDGKGHHYVLH